jgi:DNA-binding CsgD family transcriptional regulator
MDDFDRALFEAFSEVWPRLKADEDELRARLARRRSKEMLRPPRAWCLAVRASDLRIEPYHMMIVRRYGECGVAIGEEVTLDTDALKRLCAPVEIHSAGDNLNSTAKKLGTTKASLAYARKAGIFTERRIPRFRGTTAILYSERLFDPSAPLGKGPDVLWGWAWRSAAEKLPADFAQVVERRPEYRFDHEQPRQRGWRWICPGCKKRVRTIFLPMRHMDLLEHFGVKAEADIEDSVEEMPRVFGCTRCHQVRYFSRVDRHGWNQLIGHASGGMLYGREVRKPDYFKATRRRAYRPSKGRAPSKRRAQVRELLLAGQGVGAIARELGLSVNGVNNHTRVIYRMEGVHSYRELRRKMEGTHGTSSGGVPLTQQ